MWRSPWGLTAYTWARRTWLSRRRPALGPAPFIGLSVRTAEQAAAAPLALLDYVGIGGVYSTTSKTSGKSPIGLNGLREVVRVLRGRIGNFPSCGIAGI